jgi:hypothetical protein
MWPKRGLRTAPKSYISGSTLASGRKHSTKIGSKVNDKDAKQKPSSAAAADRDHGRNQVGCEKQLDEICPQSHAGEQRTGSDGKEERIE